MEEPEGSFRYVEPSPPYRDYLSHPAGTAPEASSEKVYDPPEPGTSSVLMYPPHRTGIGRAIWQDRGTERHETTESDTFAEIVRWAFTRTDSVYMVELHTSVVGGPGTTRLAPLPASDPA